jgi:hypothetical protein
MSFLETLILSSLEAVLAILLIHGILGNCQGKWLQRLSLVVAKGALVGIIDSVVKVSSLSHILSSMMIYLFIVVYIKMMYNRKLSFSTVMFFVISTLGIFIQIATILILQVVYPDFTYNFISGIYSMTASLILALALVRTQKLRIIEKYCSYKGYYRFKITLTLFFMAYYMVSVVSSSDFTQLFESFLSIVVVMILTIFATSMFVKESVLVSAYEDKISSYETQLKIIDDIIEEVRARQHDYHNHIQTLISLSETDKTSASEYAQELVDHDDIWHELLALDNKILTALFYSKYKMAKERNLKLKFDLRNNGFESSYHIFDIVEMYGILIDNAIEASNEGGSIYIGMSRHKEKNRFEVANAHDFVTSNEIRQFFTKNFSTKSTDKRGIGLYKLKEKLLKKDDQIYFSYNSDEKEIIVELEHS